MKKNIILVLITAIIFTGVGVLATTALTADQINYDENTTVKDKIDDLYTSVNAPLEVIINTQTSSNSYEATTNYRNYSHNSWLGKYSKIKYVSVETNEYTSSCKLYAVKRSDASSVEVTVGTTLTAANYANLYTKVKSTTNGKSATCAPKIKFFD